MIRVGDKVRCYPRTFAETDAECKKVKSSLTGKVTYIHPQGRFVIVAFRCRGGVIKESFALDEVQLCKK